MANGRVTVYMDEDDIADLDEYRAYMRRQLGKPINRGRLIRAALATARQYPEAWVDHADEEG